MECRVPMAGTVPHHARRQGNATERDMKIKSIMTRLFIIVGVTAVGLTILAYIGATMIQDTMMDQTVARTNTLAQVAAGVAKHFDDRVKKGEMDEKAAKDNVRRILDSLRFGPDGKSYYFGISFEGVSVQNAADPAQENTNVYDQKDPDAKTRSDAIIAGGKAAVDGPRSVFYMYKKPGGTENLRKLSSVAAYEPWHWFFGSGTYLEDVSAAFWAAVWKLALAGAIVLLVAAAITIVLSRAIARPMRQLADVAKLISEGNYAANVPATDRADEVGTLAHAILVLRDRAKAGDEQRQAHDEKMREVEKQRHAMMLSLAEKFDTSVGAVVKSVSSQASQMVGSAQTLSSTAEDATRKASTVAAASEQASANVQTVASATEELSSSIAEISRQVAQSSRVAATAVSEAEKANTMVRGLVETSQKIGAVVALITDIANQTNLLALNATIEAARAGEAGKGFAVVAAEVKNLATQTAKATEEIGAQINGVQGATQEAVEAIQTIGKTIGEINGIASTIAAAVEQQSSATKEIARNVEQAAQGTTEVTTNITSVTQAANDTGTAADQVLTSAQDLTKQSETLRNLVAAFLNDVKAA